MALVSFIMPAYKAKFLADSIQSILNQSFKNFELIILNDKSPDDILTIVKSFNDSRIKYYENDVNIGGKNLVDNWNKCLSYAKGKWGILATDDDVYDESFLNELISLSNRYSNVKLFHSRINVIDDKNNLLRISGPLNEYETFEEFVFHNIIAMRMQSVGEFMFCIESLRILGGFVQMPLAWGSDGATWCALSKPNGIVSSYKPLFSFRESGINISTLKSNMFQKVNARIEFLNYFDKYIYPFLTHKSLVQSYYSRIIVNEGRYAIMRATLNDVESSKSLKLLFRLLNDKEKRRFLTTNGLMRKVLKLLLRPN